jgi:carboxyl-terminal processing protease
MNREKIAWLVSIVLIAMLTFSLPGSLARRDDDYTFVRSLIDIHRQVATNYVEPIDEQKLEEGAIDGMLSQLDPFSTSVPPEREKAFNGMLDGSFDGVGIQLVPGEDGKIVVASPIDDSPAFHAGVEAGDILLKVNGQDVTGKKQDEVATMIQGALGTPVSLTVVHVTGEQVTLNMKRANVTLPTVKGFVRKSNNTWDYFVVKDPKIAYIRIKQFTADTFPALKTVVDQSLADGMKGLILDLRFNPGGQLDQARKVVNLFVRNGVIVSTKGRNRPEEVYRADPQEALSADFPMVVLINEHSASAAEIVSGSLMDNHRALIIGSRSFGKGSVQEVMPLDGGGELKLTVAYYYLPSGRLVHRRKGATDWGVDPQIIVPMSPEAETALFDEQADRDLFHRPMPKSATRPSTNPAAIATVPVTQPADPQLDAAISSIVGHMILTGQTTQPAAAMAAPATEPAD